MPAWLIWLIAAGGLAAAETLTLDLVLIMFAGGAAAGAIVAAVGGPFLVQVIVAAAAALALLVGVRPVAQRHLTAIEHRTGTDALVGREAIALTEVNGADGRVRLNGGEWTARAFDPERSIPAGTVVRVMQIDGATALVWSDAWHDEES